MTSYFRFFLGLCILLSLVELRLKSKVASEKNQNNQDNEIIVCQNGNKSKLNNYFIYVSDLDVLIDPYCGL